MDELTWLIYEPRIDRKRCPFSERDNNTLLGRLFNIHMSGLDSRGIQLVTSGRFFNVFAPF